jgi:hypothetical protein
MPECRRPPNGISHVPFVFIVIVNVYFTRTLFASGESDGYIFVFCAQVQPIVQVSCSGLLEQWIERTLKRSLQSLV